LGQRVAGEAKGKGQAASLAAAPEGASRRHGAAATPAGGKKGGRHIRQRKNIAIVVM